MQPLVAWNPGIGRAAPSRGSRGGSFLPTPALGSPRTALGILVVRPCGFRLCLCLCKVLLPPVWVPLYPSGKDRCHSVEGAQIVQVHTLNLITHAGTLCPNKVPGPGIRPRYVLSGGGRCSA